MKELDYRRNNFFYKCLKELTRLLAFSVLIRQIAAEPLKLHNNELIDCKNPLANGNILSCAMLELACDDIELIELNRTTVDNRLVVHYRLKNSILYPPKLAGAPMLDGLIPRYWSHDLWLEAPLPSKNMSWPNPVFAIAGGKGSPDYTDDILNDIRPKLYGTPVIDMNLVPNQPQNVLAGGQSVEKQLVEDAIVAETWRLAILNPINFPYTLHLAMAVAARQAMKQMQAIWNFEQFIILGLSKRGLAAWLVAIMDVYDDQKLAAALLAVVIPELNLQALIPDIYASFAQHFPAALQDYINAGIDQAFDPESAFYQAWIQVSNSFDPAVYMQSQAVIERLSRLPKYLLTAGGDDFFPVDALKFTRSLNNEIPSPVTYYTLANSSHFINQSPNFHEAVKAMLAFINQLQSNKTQPSIQWQFERENDTSVWILSGIIDTFGSTLQKVKKVEASNPLARDFRYACNITNTATSIDFYPVGSDQPDQYGFRINMTEPAEGWSYYYVQAEFENRFIATTIPIILPQKYPSAQQIMPEQGNCRFALPAQVPPQCVPAAAEYQACKNIL